MFLRQWGQAVGVEALGVLTTWNPSDHKAASISIINKSLISCRIDHSYSLLPQVVPIGNVSYEFYDRK